MKWRQWIVCGLLVAALALSGCAEAQSEAAAANEGIVVASAANESAGVEEETATKETSAELSELFTATDEEGLLLYSGDALSGLWYPEFTLVDGGLLVYEGFYSEDGEGTEQFVLLDLADGTATTTELACEFLTDVRQTDAGVMFADSCLGLVVLLDDELQVAQTWSIEANYEFWYVAADGESVYVIDDGNLLRVALADLADEEDDEAAGEADDDEAAGTAGSELFLLTEDSEEVEGTEAEAVEEAGEAAEEGAEEEGASNAVLSSSVSLYGTTAVGDGVNITYVDDESQLTLEVWLDLATGEVSTLDVEEAVYGLSRVGDVWLASLGYSSSAGYILGTVGDGAAEADVVDAAAEDETAAEDEAAAEDETAVKEEGGSDADAVADAAEGAAAEGAAAEGDGEFAEEDVTASLYYVAVEDGSLTLVPGSDCVLVASTEYAYDEDDEDIVVDAVSTFTLYDAEGTYLASISLEGEDVWYYGTFCVYSETYDGFFLMVYRDEGAELYFWEAAVTESDDDVESADDADDAEAVDDVEAAVEAADGDGATAEITDSDLDLDLDLDLVPLAEYESVPGGSAVDASLYERAAALSEAYGVDILIADQCATEYTDFLAEQVLDADLITAALDILEEALAAYPEGFIDQLRYDKMTHIQINLCGTLTPTNDNWGTESYNGFTEETGSVYLMVLDLNQLYTDTVWHEFSHIIDQKLTWDAYCRDDALFSEETWASLNPEGFEYAYVYSGFNDLAFEGDEYQYFIDSYSMVSPTEDRARIMEFAMAGYDWYFTDYEPTYAKLLYYCACIRDAFDTTGWPEKTAWEDVG